MLSLDKTDPNYLKNLDEARDIMEGDEVNIDSTSGLYLCYRKDYILGHIYTELIQYIDDKNQKDKLIENAITHFKLSLNQLPKSSNYLRDMIKGKIKIWEEEIARDDKKEATYIN